MAIDPGAPGPRDETREVRVDPPGVFAFLGAPPNPRGVVLFAHGSGSGRRSPRNNHVAGALRRAGLATLLMDLLTPAEEADRRNVFDIALLGARLSAATDWLEDQPGLQGLPVGYFGASTGGGAALFAAAGRQDVAAVVSRGGRPDLAGPALPEVRAPTLLIVGGRDEAVIDLNRAAMARMRAEAELVLVPGAGHLFEEPGTLDEVIRLARDWFLDHFTGPAQRGSERDSEHERRSPDLR